MRVATIDIGTNAVLLLVAERGGDGRVLPIRERAEITRLGEGVDRTRQLSAAAIERTIACLSDYAREVDALEVDEVAIVGTSAMRDAGGASLTSFVRNVFGVEPRVLSGDEEARLTFRGALRGMPVDPRVTAAVFDVGGGSTEVIIGRLDGARLDAQFLQSFDVGSVRLTERHVRHDPPTSDELRGLQDSLTATFAPVPPLPSGVVPVGVAGTMTTLAAVALRMVTYDGARVHGHPLSTSDLRDVVMRLAACSVDERRRLPGMEPKRADVIVAGGCIALALLEHWSASTSLVSDGGVRWGLADELLSV
jgi:exopolyphosphatase/guanosine-5'-triphosphate,3'-diphosphate pyrophosphatase